MSLEPIVQLLSKRKEHKLAVDILNAFNKFAFHYAEYDDLAKCAFKIKEYPLAIKFSESLLAVAKSPEELYTARANLINVLNHANHPEKAMRLIRANESVIPDDISTSLEKAYSYYLLNDKDAAEKILRKELERPDLSDEMRNTIMFNLGTYEMHHDNFLYGLELFLIEGRRIGIWKDFKIDGEFWMGQPPDDRELLIFAEAGIGDEIINVRFMKILQDRGYKPVWYTDRKDTAEMFRHSGFNVITNLKDRPKNSMWTFSMSLPLYLELEYKDLWYGPYIVPDPVYVEKYKRDFGMPKIGIRWEGNPEYDNDLHRKVPLAEILTAVPTGNVLYSLQRDTGLDQLKDYPYIFDMSPDMTTFMDTLGIIQNLDIVITSCTSVAHAAAAMGKRVFVFVPISGYYVWAHSMKQSPWYGDNVTILRQTKPRSWAEPIAELKTYLQ